MSEAYVENSITEKMRQVRPPSAPIKPLDRISLEIYKDATRPATKQGSVNVKIDPSKLQHKK